MDEFCCVSFRGERSGVESFFEFFFSVLRKSVRVFADADVLFLLHLTSSFFLSLAFSIF